MWASCLAFFVVVDVCWKKKITQGLEREDEKMKNLTMPWEPVRFEMFLTELSNVYLGCFYLIKNTVKKDYEIIII